jgi:hypothetical protein
MMRVVLVLLRRLWLPLVFFRGFSLMCVLVYHHLEGLRWQDVFFWIINPHAIEYRRVRDTTKFFRVRGQSHDRPDDSKYYPVLTNLESWGERRHHFHREFPVI